MISHVSALLCDGPGGYFIKFSVFGFQHAKKTWTQSDLKSMKKGVIWIENTGENLYKMLKIC